MTLKDVPYLNEKSMENALAKNGIYFSIYYNAQLGLIDKVHAIKLKNINNIKILKNNY